MAEQLAKRCDIPMEKRWATEDIFDSTESWETSFAEVKKAMEQLEVYRGRLGESAEVLLEYLNLQNDLSRQVELLYMYAHLNADVDTADNEKQSYAMRTLSLWNQLCEAASFAEPEMMGIAPEVLAKWQQSDPGYGVYARFFELLEQKRKHTRSAEVEAVLAAAGEMAQSPSQIFTMLNNADARFPSITGEDGEEVMVTHGRYGLLMESKNREVRKAAFASMYSLYTQLGNTLAAAFTGNIRQDIFFAKARGYSSTRAMHLASGNIPEEVYDNLIAVVHENLPKMYRYVALRKKLLGLSELHLYDVYVSVVPEVEWKVSYEEAKETILKALEPMGEEYLTGLRSGFENRWIDACENEGKRSGAYCSGGCATHPYVLMTYKGTLDNMFTLAHEMGHAMHSYFSSKYQPYQTAEYLIFVAEVASICNEILLTKYLLSTTEDKNRRAYVLNHFLDDFKGTIFRQVMFAEFEMLAHRRMEAGEALSASDLNEMYYKLNETYFGPDMTVDREIEREWSRIPHFYTPFYVYQYATGFAAAAALAQRILDGGAAAVADYMKFLTGGCSKDPIELLRMAGVDMSKKEPVQAAMKLFGEMLDEFEALMAE